MRVIVGLLFLFAVFACALPGRADPLPTADEIKAKAAAFEGPEPANYRETIVGTGTDGDVKEVTYRNGDDVRHTSDRGGIHFESGTYHGESWNLEENGLVVIRTPDPGQAARDTRSVTVQRVTRPLDAFVVADLNARSAGTRTYYDPATFRVLRIESVGAGGTRTTTFGDVERFGNRMLARDWSVSWPETKFNMRYERIEYIAGAATEADVAEPSTTHQVVDFPLNVTSADLPVRFIDNSAYVRVNVGSRAVDFLLNTGAPAIYLDAAFAREMGLKLVNGKSEASPGQPDSYAIVPDISIGTLHLHDAVAHLYARPLPFQPPGAKAVGVLGFDFLAQLGVTIDWEHQVVRVVPAANFVPPSDPATLAFAVRLGTGVPMVTVQVRGFTAERVALMSGSNVELIFYDYFTRRYPGAFSASDDLGATELYRGSETFEADAFRLHDVRLGPLHLQDFTAFRVPQFIDSSSYADGIIGNVLLSKFIVSLDYTDGMVYLTPTDDTKRAMHPLK